MTAGGGLSAALARAPASTVEEVIARLVEIDGVLPAADGISCFNRLYLAVTRNVLGGITGGAFVAPHFVAALDVAFANLYFAALRAFDGGSLETPRAWRPLFEARASAAIAPIQFALSGMNAHINRDLPVAVVETFAALGLPLRADGAPHVDYLRINDVLAATEKQVKDLYLDPLARQLDRVFAGVDDVVAIWSVTAARHAAWTNADALWHLRALPAVATAYLDTLDRTVGFASRGLLL
ncbi:MAG TPA: DUF5995 family protein, partial [Polyangia bacterium]